MKGSLKPIVMKLLAEQKKTYGYEITQRMGDTDFMFETFTGTGCTGKYPDGLRCYEDDFIGLYKPFIASCTAVVSGINDVTVEPEDVMLYPNPAHNNVTIEIPESWGNSTCQINDITGRTIFFGQFNQKSTFDLSEISRGVYFVELRSCGKHHNQKLIIQ